MGCKNGVCTFGPEEDEVTKYPIVEVFSSIQGEGCLIGTPATFIRLHGCNLQCPWCDTKRTWAEEMAETGMKRYREMTVEEIMEKVDQHLVVITGGEPLIHNLLPLISALVLEGKFIAIETNGTIEIDSEVNSLINWVACAPKPPLYEMKVYPNEMKFVVGTNETSTPEVIAEVIERLRPKGRSANKVAAWLQPEGSDWKTHIGLCYDLAMKRPDLNCRVGLQLHKVITESTNVEVE